MRTLFEKGSISEKILSLVYFNGELPYRALRLIGNNTESVQRCARRLLEQGYLKLDTPIKKQKSLCLGEKRYLKEAFPGAQQRYVKRKEILKYRDTNHTAKIKRKRNINVAYTMTFLLESGCTLWGKEKERCVREGETLVTGYALDEIKEYMDPMDARACSTSATAFLCSGEEYSLVYLLDTEKRTRTMSERDSIPRIEDVMNRGAMKGYIEQAWLLSMRKSYTGSILFGKEKPFSIEGLEVSFRSIYVVPFDREGIRIMKMNYTEAGREKLRQMVLRQEERARRKGALVDCDGMEESGELLLQYMVPDIQKLNRFLQYLMIRERLGKKTEHTIFCFDNQEEELRSAAELAGIKELNLDIYELSYIEKIWEQE